MELMRVIVFLFGCWFLTLLLFILIKLGIFNFFEKILPFPFLRENYNGSLNLYGLTFQGQSIWLFIISSLAGGYALFFHEINFLGNFGLFLMFFFPGFMCLLRIRTFSDDNILKETGKGYDTFKCWTYFFLSSFLGFVIGFAQLTFHGLFDFPTLMIILAFIFGTIPMFPDYINKYLSYDVRSEKGEYLFTGLVFIANISQIVGIFILGLFIGF